MVMNAGEGHIASSFSCIEILTALYFHQLNVDSKYPNWKNRDRFILSKGHACLALYTVLALKSFFPKEILKTYGNAHVLQ